MIELQSPLVTEANLFLETYSLTFEAHSVRVKQTALTQLIQYLMQQQIDDWALCDDKVLRGYIIFRAKKPMDSGKRKLNSASIETQLASIRIFYQFLFEKALITYNYARLISPPKKERRLPKVVEADLLNQILDRPPENDLEVRDLAVLELLYSSGLRLAEIAALKIPHINFQEQMLRVIDGKGGKDRVVPMGDKALQALQKWLTVREMWLQADNGLDDHLSLFISKKGDALSDRQISRRVKAYAEKSGVNINLHPHLLRHSMATHVLESSQDIRLVQELLGHADIATTQVYTHLNFNHLAKVFDAAHPRAKRSRLSKKRKEEDSKS
ncbi:tyrosine recombinase XerC [Ignatzschineria rhizosphaerae]|uniref:Tyrosine recombinase XerC n=1 Tax=Ignatzschineria rhizosphaerae TaxID=2923279 RepID=A0ABY3WZE0_9GAMM|nr:tyrosine recombinase XerC [Ignatzschineria rhizosphaerae]UNM96009.1 tyrosine recombinase XerC [Ignatzschineria rhizosphaerae]